MHLGKDVSAIPKILNVTLNGGFQTSYDFEKIALFFGLSVPLTCLDVFFLPSCLPLQTQETREILHFHYTTWPDFGVPESPASFLNFLFKVRESGCLNSDQGPVVVHCSAGIGRSGTFCLVDTCLLLVCTDFLYWEIMQRITLNSLIIVISSQ